VLGQAGGQPLRVRDLADPGERHDLVGRVPNDADRIARRVGGPRLVAHGPHQDVGDLGAQSGHEVVIGKLEIDRRPRRHSTIVAPIAAGGPVLDRDHNLAARNEPQGGRRPARLTAHVRRCSA
jgi:hypothetical protein